MLDTGLPLQGTLESIEIRVRGGTSFRLLATREHSNLLETHYCCCIADAAYRLPLEQELASRLLTRIDCTQSRPTHALLLNLLTSRHWR